MADGRMYTLPFSAVAVTAAVDFWEIRPADDKPVEIVMVRVGQTTEVASNVGEDEFLGILVVRGNTTTGTGGTQSVTPTPVDPVDAAAGFGADLNNTTAASAGTAVTVWADTFNVRTGWQETWPAGCGPRSTETAGFLCVRLAGAPADSVTFTGTILVREV